MKIISSKVFPGRNIYTHKKCIRLNLDLEGYSEVPTKEIDGFNLNLVSMLPELANHRSDIDEDRGFIKRLIEGTYLAHVSEQIIIALHNRIGMEISYGKARKLSGENYYVIYQYQYANSGLEAGNIAVDLINSLINKEPFDLSLRINKLKEQLRSEQLGLSTLAICNEAKKRGIPVLRIGEESIFQLGYGKHSKTIQATLGSGTSQIAVSIAQDKLLTKELLSLHCLPIASGLKITSKKTAIAGAKDLGYPLVMKPQFGNQGKGVIANIKDEIELLNAYDLLAKDYDNLMLEKHINGSDYRVCVVYGDVVAVSKRIPPYITGDGTSSIETLIGKINEDTRRGEGHERELTKIKIDNNLKAHLKQKNYSLDSLLPKNETLYLKDNANLSTGGFAIDCTDSICDENIEYCKRSASAIGLDICGIDLLCEDIGKPLDQGGAIIEVNAAPGIRMHHNPASGIKRNVAAHIVDKLFQDSQGTIPLVAITGTNGKTTTTRLIAHILSFAGYTVGMTTTDGIYIDGKCIHKGDTTGPKSASAVLMNKNIDAAVLETARGGIIRGGLAYDLADVGVITNITQDHLGIDEVETMEDLAKVKALVGEAVKEDGYVVINGDDTMSISILPRLKSNLIIFSQKKDNIILRSNLKNGGIGIYADEGNIVIEKDSRTEILIDINSISITFNGILKYNLLNVLASCAAAIGLGIDYAILRQGLSSFTCNQNPGRFNMYHVDNKRVILDYGHNKDGYNCVIDGLKQIEHRQLIGVIGVPGDRSDKDIQEVGKCAGDNFDVIFIKEDQDNRGRAPGEVADLLKKGVLTSTFNPGNIRTMLKETDALEAALDLAEPEDIIIVFFEKADPLLEILRRKKNEMEVGKVPLAAK